MGERCNGGARRRWQGWDEGSRGEWWWWGAALGGGGLVVILDVQPLGYDPNPGAFLDGTKHFVVTSQCSTCECESPCQWTDRVVWYRDRSVVIKQSQMHTINLGNVIRQLRGE